MNSRHSRGPSDGEGLSMGPGGLNLNLARATPIKPQLGMPPMTREGKESRDQAQAWDLSLNRIFQTMQGEDSAKYLNYFKARLDIEETYARALEKLAIPGKGTKSSGINNNIGNNAATGNTGGPDPEDIPTTLQLAFDALLESTQQAFLRRRPFVSLIRNLIGALTGLKVPSIGYKKCTPLLSYCPRSHPFDKTFLLNFVMLNVVLCSHGLYNHITA